MPQSIQEQHVVPTAVICAGLRAAGWGQNQADLERQSRKYEQLTLLVGGKAGDNRSHSSTLSKYVQLLANWASLRTRTFIRNPLYTREDYSNYRAASGHEESNKAQNQV